MKRAFTLLEVLLSLAILTLLSVGVFAVARGSMRLGTKIVRAQAAATRVERFLDLLAREFENLPPNAKIRLEVEESARSYVSRLVIEDAPTAFRWQWAAPGYEVVVLRTIREARGSLSVGLITATRDTWESVGKEAAALPTDFELILLDNLEVFEWQCLNANTEEYEPVWETPSRRPLLMELYMVFFGMELPARRIFRVPLPNKAPSTYPGATDPGNGDQKPPEDGAPPSPNNPGGRPGTPSTGTTPSPAITPGRGRSR